jgi:hypothetical protein
VRSRLPPPSTLKQLKDVLREEWYSIALQNIQNLYESIPRRIQAALQAMIAQLRINKEMCIFHSCFHYFVRPLYRSLVATVFTSAKISANL